MQSWLKIIIGIKGILGWWLISLLLFVIALRLFRLLQGHKYWKWCWWYYSHYDKVVNFIHQPQYKCCYWASYYLRYHIHWVKKWEIEPFSRFCWALRGVTPLWGPQNPTSKSTNAAGYNHYWANKIFIKHERITSIDFFFHCRNYWY